LIKEAQVVLLRPPDPMGMVDILSHVLPTNLGYLAAYLQQGGIGVEIWDYEQDSFAAVEFLKRLEMTAPIVVGISCMTPTIINGHNVASLVKKHFPNIVTVVGGAHSSAMPEETLGEFPNFDLVVNQEGEATFLELCQRALEGDGFADLTGVTRRDGEDIIREEGRSFIDNLDDIPYPARELYQNPNKFRGHSTRGFSNKLNSTEIFTSRGCPYKCTFCAIVATFDRTVRFRSPQNVFDEVKEVKERFNIDHIVVADDTFGLKKGRIEELCDGFGSLGLNSWNCDTRVDCVDKDILQLMKDSGCTKVAFGIESGSERVIALNEKKIDLDRVREAVRYANEVGIKNVEGNFIIGSHPDETLEDLELTQKLIRELPLTFVSISVIVPFPGTPNFTTMKERGDIFSEDWANYVMFGQAPVWRTKHFGPEDLIRHQRRLNRQFYLNSRYMTRMLLKIRSLSELAYYAKAGKAFIRWSFGGSAGGSGSEMDLSDASFQPISTSQ
jgi:anaerobic magnesium-protoporphyrin IX monomethyl ester cyclase